MALLGDSSAAGYGVEKVQETPGAHLASGLAEGAERRVYLRSVAKVGAQTRDLKAQIDDVLTVEPDVAVIMIGGNDVTHARLPSESVRLLSEGVRRLRAAGVEVVVGTCPDLGTIEPIAPPLKQVARTWSRRLAAAQTVAVVEAGGRTVSLGSVLGPEFAATPKVLFGPDRFHPSAAGYSQPGLGAAAVRARRRRRDPVRGARAGGGAGRDRAADLAGRRRGRPQPRHRDRRHRGGRRHPWSPRPLGAAPPPPAQPRGAGRGTRPDADGAAAPTPDPPPSDIGWIRRGTAPRVHRCRYDEGPRDVVPGPSPCVCSWVSRCRGGSRGSGAARCRSR